MIRLALWLLALVLAACTTPPAASSSPLATPYRGYLPIISAARPPTPTPQPTSTPPTCFENEKAAQLFALLSGDSRQQRPRLRCDRRLVIAAQRRAAALIRDGTWAHVDAQGVWANDYARAAGCVLPAHYGPHNNIESLFAGSPDPQLAIVLLSASPGHAPHVLGLNDFFSEQDRIGIGYAVGGRFGFYWVVLIARCE